MTEIIANENAIVQKLRWEGREENLRKIGFEFFKGNLKTSVRKKKKILFQPKLYIMLKRGLILKKKSTLSS